MDLAKPYVKRSFEPVRAEDVPGEILRAYHTAMQQPRGPVFVSIPMDDWEAEAEPLEAHDVVHRTAPDPDAIERFASCPRAKRGDPRARGREQASTAPGPSTTR